MNMVCLDLEGVLLPEIWIAFAEASGLTELKRTTRDEPDYDKLMRFRLNVLEKNKIKIDNIRKIINTLDPLPGAVEFTSKLMARTRTIILSDTFEEFAEPLMGKLGHPTLFCHNLEVSKDGDITGYRLRQEDQKRHAVEAFKKLNFTVIAAGDSYNDLTMIRAADHGILFRPTDKMRSENSDLPVATDHDALYACIEEVL